MDDTMERADPRRIAAMGEIADAVLAAEHASDALIAAAGTLLSTAVANRIATGVPVMTAQRVVDHLEKMVVSQFESRRALLAAHGSLTAIARVSRGSPEAAWGPDSSCPQAKVPPMSSVELRSVA